MEQRGEEWMDVAGFGGRYRVSSTGRVLSVGHTTIDKRGRARTLQDKYLSLCYGRSPKYGYAHVSLSRGDGTAERVWVHRLVATAFIPNPNNLPQVNHKDGNKRNNKVENLEWCTIRDNLLHSFRTGLHNNEYFEKEAAKRAVRVVCPDGNERIFKSVHEAAFFIGYKYDSHLSRDIHKRHGKCINGFYAYRVDGKRN